MVLIVYNELHQALPLCSSASTGFINCDAVLSSKYSQVFGIPLEVFAIVYFMANLAMVFLIAFGSEWLYPKVMRVLFRLEIYWDTDGFVSCHC